MKKELYRKEIVEKNGIDKIDDYMKINKPGLIIVLLSITALLLAFVFWSIFGKIETKISTYAYIENNTCISYVTPDVEAKLKKDMKVYINNVEGKINEVSLDSVETKTLSTSELYYFNLETDSICYQVKYELPSYDDGFHEIKIVTEVITPFSFIFKG